MGERTRTTRRMLRQALEIAIQSDVDLIDCGGGDDRTAGDVMAYRRILTRYFGSPLTTAEKSYDGLKSVSLAELMEGAESETQHE